MSFFHNLVHHPRKLFLRKALFQIHLWAGIALSAYVVVIALTGSILVFEDELTATTLPPGLSRYDAARTAAIPKVMHQFTQACPGCSATFLTTPSPVVPAFQIRATDKDRNEVEFVADAVSGAIYRQPRTWVNWVHDLHLYLLLGAAHGVQVNGVGAVILLLLCITGLFLWWPGVKNWSRGFRINLRYHWRRINFDAHHAIGIWTLALVSWWAISSIYFAWYRQFEAAVNAVFPLRGMLSPQLPSLAPESNTRAPLGDVLIAAQRASPKGHLFGLSDPSMRGTTVFAQMDLRAPGDFSHRDIVTIDTSNARVLTVWHYGQNHSLGDWIMWSMHPLHFGTLWGLPCKILWFLLGLSLAILTVTGLIMYWNRYLRHRIPKRAYTVVTDSVMR
jgi:uncharacterized iron-regulated membrane protein